LLGFDLVRGQGIQNYTARQDGTYIVPVSGRVTIGDIEIPRWQIGYRENAGAIDIELLDDDSKVFMIWDRT
jgi:hypothetical protein